MSGFFQFCVGQISAGTRIGTRVARLLSARMVALALLLSLALVAANTRAVAQEKEPDEGGMSDTSLKKKGKADEKDKDKKAAEVVPPPAGITFTTNLDHTAVWVGDQFHYRITVETTPDYEFVLDNLTKETVNMDPFQVMDVAKSLTPLKGNNKRLVVDLKLASFGTGQTSLTIPQFTLYYFRKDRKVTSADQAAAESLTIPGPVIGSRSTLPPQAQDIRDAITVNSWASVRWTLPTIGYICLVILIAGGAWEAYMQVKMRKQRKGPDRRKAMEAVRSKWSSSVPSDFSDPKTASEFFNQTSKCAKEFVEYFLETPTAGLTAEELKEEMDRMGAMPEFTRKVVKVIDTCETLGYSQNGANHSEAGRSISVDMRDILSTKD